MFQISVLVGLEKAAEVVDSGVPVGAPVSVSVEGSVAFSVISMEDVGKESSMGSLVSELVIVTEVALTDPVSATMLSDEEITGASDDVDVVCKKFPF